MLSGTGSPSSPQRGGLSIPGPPQGRRRSGLCLRTPAGTGVVSCPFSGPARPLACGGAWQKGGRRGDRPKPLAAPLILHNFPHPPPRAGEGRSGGSCTPRVPGKAADGHRTKHPKAAIKRGPAPAHSWPPRSGPALLLEKVLGQSAGCLWPVALLGAGPRGFIPRGVNRGLFAKIGN